MKSLFYIAAFGVFAALTSSCSFNSDTEDCACNVKGSKEELHYYDQENCSSLSDEDKTCRAL